jgi:hypothetical protein
MAHNEPARLIRSPPCLVTRPLHLIMRVAPHNASICPLASPPIAAIAAIAAILSTIFPLSLCMLYRTTCISPLASFRVPSRSLRQCLQCRPTQCVRCRPPPAWWGRPYYSDGIRRTHLSIIIMLPAEAPLVGAAKACGAAEDKALERGAREELHVGQQRLEVSGPAGEGARGVGGGVQDAGGARGLGKYKGRGRMRRRGNRLGHTDTLTHPQLGARLRIVCSRRHTHPHAGPPPTTPMLQPPFQPHRRRTGPPLPVRAGRSLQGKGMEQEGLQ